MTFKPKMEAGLFITHFDYLSIYSKIYVFDSLIGWVIFVCEKELALENPATTTCDELCFCWESGAQAWSEQRETDFLCKMDKF